MARIEELPDDFDESLKLNGSSESSAPVPFPLGAREIAKDDKTISLPPQMASVRSHTADEIVQMMNKTPLFMTSLEETEGEGMWPYLVRSLKDSYLNLQARREHRTRGHAGITI